MENITEDLFNDDSIKKYEKRYYNLERSYSPYVPSSNERKEPRKDFSTEFELRAKSYDSDYEYVRPDFNDDQKNYVLKQLAELAKAQAASVPKSSNKVVKKF